MGAGSPVLPEVNTTSLHACSSSSTPLPAHTPDAASASASGCQAASMSPA